MESRKTVQMNFFVKKKLRDIENKHMDTKGGRRWDGLGDWNSYIYT